MSSVTPRRPGLFSLPSSWALLRDRSRPRVFQRGVDGSQAFRLGIEVKDTSARLRCARPGPEAGTDLVDAFCVHGCPERVGASGNRAFSLAWVRHGAKAAWAENPRSARQAAGLVVVQHAGRASVTTAMRQSRVRPSGARGIRPGVAATFHHWSRAVVHGLHRQHRRAHLRR